MEEKKPGAADSIRKENRQAGRPVNKKLVIAAVILIVILAAGLAGAHYIGEQKITSIDYIGGTIYSNEELTAMIFGEEEPGSFAVWYREKTKVHDEIPFVDSYELNFDGMHHVTVTALPKNVVGCLSYMGCLMYFDRDGRVVESTFDRLEHIPLIDGIRFDRVVLGEVLEVADERIFSVILNLTQQLQKYELRPDVVRFRPSGTIDLVTERVTVKLGRSEYLEEKIAKLSGIWESLEGLDGILDMEEYDGSGNGNFIFRKNE